MRQSRENKAQSRKRDSALKAECYNKAAGFVHEMTKRARRRERVKRDGNPREEEEKKKRQGINNGLAGGERRMR